MIVTSLNIEKNLYVKHDKIINIQDFNSEKLSVIRNSNNKIHVYYDRNPFFLSINGLNGYFEGKDNNEKNRILGPKITKYLTIIFTSEYQKFMYKKILKKIGKDINRNYVKIKLESRDNVPLNILVNIHNLVLVIKYQKVYISTCQYNQFCKEIQIPELNHKLIKKT